MPELPQEAQQARESPAALVPVTDEEPSDAAMALSPIQREAVSLLLAGQTQAATAAAIGRSERTLRYWVLQPQFRKAMREGNDARLKEACSLLGSRSTWAILRLEQLAQSEKVSGHAQVAAAKALVHLALSSFIPMEQSEQLAEIRVELDEIREERKAEREW